MNQNERVGVAHLSLWFMFLLGAVGILFEYALTTEFHGDPVVDPVGYAASSVWFAAAFTVLLLAMAAWLIHTEGWKVEQ